MTFSKSIFALFTTIKLPFAAFECIITHMKNCFVKTPIKPIVSVTGIYTIHYFNYGRKFCFEGKRHNFWELVYIDRGKATIVADDNCFELSQGEAFFHKPNQFHTIKTLEFASSIIITFSANGDCSFFEDRRIRLSNAEQIMLGNIITENALAFSDAPDEIYTKELHFRENAPVGATQMIRCYLECLLITLMRKKNGHIPLTKAQTDTELTIQIKRILNENLYSDITLDELSRKLFFSKTYLGEKFKADTGQSIKSYYNNLKIDEAKRLISTGQYSFTQISNKLGFGSTQYFTRMFKKVVHATPSEWAKSTKVDNVLH